MPLQFLKISKDTLLHLQLDPLLLYLVSCFIRPVDFARLATFHSPCSFLRILLDLFLLLYLLLSSLRFRYVYTLKMVSTTEEIQRSDDYSFVSTKSCSNGSV